MKTINCCLKGKVTNLKQLLSLIPTHTVYTEVYGNGEALLFGKKKSKKEYINEPLGGLLHFKLYFSKLHIELENEIRKWDNNPHMYEHALHIYHYQNLFDPVKILWAVWYLNRDLFEASFEHNHSGTTPFEILVKKMSGNFYFDFYYRLKDVNPEVMSPVKFLHIYDTPDAFHYIDPPFMNNNCPFYKSNFKEKSLTRLLEILPRLQGKFMLTLPVHPALEEAATENKWKIIGAFKDDDLPHINCKTEKYIVINYTQHIFR